MNALEAWLNLSLNWNHTPEPMYLEFSRAAGEYIARNKAVSLPDLGRHNFTSHEGVI